jgi:hypothetical protein
MIKPMPPTPMKPRDLVAWQASRQAFYSSSSDRAPKRSGKLQGRQSDCFPSRELPEVLTLSKVIIPVANGLANLSSAMPFEDSTALTWDGSAWLSASTPLVQFFCDGSSWVLFVGKRWHFQAFFNLEPFAVTYKDLGLMVAEPVR